MRATGAGGADPIGPAIKASLEALAGVNRLTASAIGDLIQPPTPGSTAGRIMVSDGAVWELASVANATCNTGNNTLTIAGTGG